MACDVSFSSCVIFFEDSLGRVNIAKEYTKLGKHFEPHRITMTLSFKDLYRMDDITKIKHCFEYVDKPPYNGNFALVYTPRPPGSPGYAKYELNLVELLPGMISMLTDGLEHKPPTESLMRNEGVRHVHVEPVYTFDGLGFGKGDIFTEPMPGEKSPTMEDVFEQFGFGYLYKVIPDFKEYLINKNEDHHLIKVDTTPLNNLDETLKKLEAVPDIAYETSRNSIYIKIKHKKVGIHTKPAIH